MIIDADIESGVREYLRNHKDVKAATGVDSENLAKVHPEVAPQGTTRPYITFSIIGAPAYNHMLAASGIASPTFQFDVWAENSPSRRTVGRALRLALDGYTGPMGDVPVRRVLAESRPRNTFERPEDGTENFIYRQTHDYRIWHEEEVPIHFD